MGVSRPIHFPVPSDPNTFVCGEFFIPEALETATHQENPYKGLLMIGAVAGGIVLLVLLAPFFGAI